jgi:tRNA-dihydrouridine synthase B
MSTTERLRESWSLGPLRVPNRVLLAPLAGIGNWFVRLQAKRYGAGMAVSEMVSTHAVHYRNERTWRELLRIDPREREKAGEGREAGPVSIQLFGEDPAIMRSAAAHVAAGGADVIDINMGCPVAKVSRTGAGAALLDDPNLAVALARAAGEGAAEGCERPVPITVKLRSGVRTGEDSGFELAHRLVEEAGVAAIAFHPRSAAVHHKGTPDYELAGRLVRSLPAPVILTGGLDDPASVHEAIEQTGAEAVMLARGALGNPWLFSELLGERELPPSREEVLDELDWTIDCAVEHLGPERATRYLRKFYPWYIARLELEGPAAAELARTLQRIEALEGVREALGPLRAGVPIMR